jgi:hypothetical protein
MGVESHDRCWQIWGTSSRCQDLRLASKRRGLSSWRNGGGAIELMLDAYDLLKIFQIYMIHLYEYIYIYIHNIYIYTDIHILYRVCIYSVYQYARHIWSCVNADLLASCCWSIALGLPPIEQWLLNPGLLFYGLIVFVQQIVYGCLWGYTIQIYWGWSPLILRKIRWTSSVHQVGRHFGSWTRKKDARFVHPTPDHDTSDIYPWPLGLWLLLVINAYSWLVMVVNF